MADQSFVNQLTAGGILLPRWTRRIAQDAAPERSLPELNLMVGRDSRGGGSTVWAWLPTAGQWPAYKQLAAHRWRNPPQSLEECVVIAQRLLRAVAENEGYPLG